MARLECISAQVERVLRSRGYQQDEHEFLVGPCPWCGAGETVFRWYREKGAFHNTCPKHEPAGGAAVLADLLLIGRLLADVKPEQVKSIFGGRIHLGKIHLIDGDPGLGKTLLVLDLAARMSSGLPMPDGSLCEAAGVVILSAEDGLADTIRPRLEAAGADLSRIVAIDLIPDPEGDRFPQIPGDLSLIEQAIIRVDARLLIVDPIMAFLGAETNSFRDQDVRRALAPVSKMAERLGTAVLAVRHLNKRNDGNPLYRGGGSIAFTGAARSTFLVAPDPEDSEKRVLAGIKNNLRLIASSLAYCIVPTNSAIRIEWLGVSTHTAKSLLGGSIIDKSNTAPEAVDLAVEKLREILGNGRVLADMAKAEVQRAGISARTLDRAKKKLGVRSKKIGGPWFWELPAWKEVNEACDATVGDLHENNPLEGSQDPDITQEYQERQERQGAPAAGGGAGLGDLDDAEVIE